MNSYPNSISVLEQELLSAPESEITELARCLIKNAKAFDLNKTRELKTHARFSHILRNQDDPTDYTDQSILGASWADDEIYPLQQGERWNSGRRATSTGLSYIFNHAGFPINPYMNTGLNGRGVLGQFGPNNAVDNGVVVIKLDENGNSTFYILGILRKFDDNAPVFSGGFAKYHRQENGEYIFDPAQIVDTQLEELFEEMISGSIDLLPEYQACLQQDLEDEIALRMSKRNGVPISDEDILEITGQLETALKLRQVKEKDPNFLNNLRHVIKRAHPCFAGPVLNDGRNTNNAWIESRLSWFLFDDALWEKIKGENPAFDYKFSAGDDASKIVYHRVDVSFVEKAYASHGAMAMFLAASFLLEQQKQHKIIDPSILNQFKAIAEHFESQSNHVSICCDSIAIQP